MKIIYIYTLNSFYFSKANFALQMIYTQGVYIVFSHAIDSMSLPTQAFQGQH